MATTSAAQALNCLTWSTRMADSVMARYPLRKAKWHYEHGLVLQALWETSAVARREEYERLVLDWMDRFVTPRGEIHGYRVEEFNLDQINPGKMLFPAYRHSGEERYRKAIELLREQLRRQPRTQSGGFWHKKIYPHQMWLDGIYMASPFYLEWSREFHEPAGYDDVVQQILLIESHTRDPKTGLLYHAWDESRDQRWANPETGCSPSFWGRAVGWFAMAVVDGLDFLPGDHPQRPVLVSILGRLMDSVRTFQDAGTGLWFQILDQGTREGNYLESSASAMFAYVMAKGVRKGHLPGDFLVTAKKAFDGLVAHKVAMDEKGVLTLKDTAGGTGLGGRPYRDGSFSYYIGEKINTNDFKGVGPFILAGLELHQAGSEQPG
jgi:unsaturated rhamnogalacturonyl hydrolase